jgi:hypothetical protein
VQGQALSSSPSTAKKERKKERKGKMDEDFTISPMDQQYCQLVHLCLDAGF